MMYGDNTDGSRRASAPSQLSGEDSNTRSEQRQYARTVDEARLHKSLEGARRDWRNNGERLAAGATGAAGKNQNRWIDDLEAVACFQCGTAFDWARRKHHCRKCGMVFCARCTTSRAILPDALHSLSSKKPKINDPQRVCDPCAVAVEASQGKLRETSSNACRTNTVDLNSARRHFNSPVAFTLGHEIRKAAFALNNLVISPNMVQDQSIPLPLLSSAQGLAFITMVKAGFMVTGRVGTGLVVARTADGGWSAPSAIATLGMGWGAQLGAEVTDYIFVLTDRAAVTAFSGRGQLSLGAEVSVAVGPVGRSMEGNVNVGDEGYSAVYAYAHSRGLFAGVSLEGKVIASRPDVNQTFYGCPVAPQDLLAGRVSRPRAGEPLYEVLRLLNPYQMDHAQQQKQQQQQHHHQQYVATPTPPPHHTFYHQPQHDSAAAAAAAAATSAATTARAEAPTSPGNSGPVVPSPSPEDLPVASRTSTSSSLDSRAEVVTAVPPTAGSVPGVAYTNKLDESAADALKRYDGGVGSESWAYTDKTGGEGMPETPVYNPFGDENIGARATAF